MRSGRREAEQISWPNGESDSPHATMNRPRRQLSVTKVESAILSLGEKNGSTAASILRFLSQANDDRPTRLQVKTALMRAQKTGHVVTSQTEDQKERAAPTPRRPSQTSTGQHYKLTAKGLAFLLAMRKGAKRRRQRCKRRGRRRGRPRGGRRKQFRPRDRRPARPRRGGRRRRSAHRGRRGRQRGRTTRTRMRRGSAGRSRRGRR